MQSKRFFVPANLTDDLKRLIYEHHRPCEILYYKYLYIIHHLYVHATLYKDRYEKNGVGMNAKKLYTLIGSADKAPIFRNLLAWNIIEFEKKYSVGENSNHYKLHENVVSGQFNILNVSTNDAPFIEPLIQKEDSDSYNQTVLKKQKQILQNHVRLTEEGLNHIFQKYPYPEIEQAINLYRNEQRIKDDLLITIPINSEDFILFKFLYKDFHPKRPDKKSRIYNTLTSLKREYRALLMIDNKPIYQTDLINSQVLFSVPVLISYFRMKAGKKLVKFADDFDLYKSLAEQGKIYETLALELGIVLDEKNRTNFKTRFFGEVFFSRPAEKRKTKLQKAFERLFPTVAKAINEIKKKDYREFALRLQRMEASIMIDVVLKQLLSKGVKALSIHDSIVVNNKEDIQLVERLISEALLNKYNVSAKFKIDEPKNFVAPVPHENIKWYDQFDGLNKKGNIYYTGNCSIDMRTDEVRRKGLKHKIRYRKETLKKLIASNATKNW